MPKGIFKRKPFTEEHKRKISKSNKGKHYYWLGKKFSEEHRKKMSETAKKKGFGKWSKGKKLSLETIQKIVQKTKQTQFKKGNKHPNWRGGITPLRYQILNLPQYKNWRKKIYERDDFTCQWCKKRGGKIAADHYPESFSEILFHNNIISLKGAKKCKQLWNINNGRVLCFNCHKKTDNYGFNYRYLENFGHK